MTVDPSLEQAGLRDDDVLSFAETIAGPLLVQLRLVKMMSRPVDPNPRAVGYVYGWADAFLQANNQNMADANIGVPVLFHAFRHLWPGQEAQLTKYIVDHVEDSTVVAGMMYGGQQY